MGTDWFIKAECPRPDKEAKDKEEHIKACSRCPFVIWEKPESVAGFMSSMCGVRVGSIGMAADLDDIGQKLTGIPYFTKVESSASMKLNILQQIKEYSQRNGWDIDGFSQQDTLEHLDSLIEFCKRAEEKRLNIAVWA
jgi:hypothetical protein